MRYEHDEERDVIRAVYSEEPVVRTLEHVHQGCRTLTGLDANGKLVFSEVQDASKLVNSAAQTKRREVAKADGHDIELGSLRWKVYDVEAKAELSHGVSRVMLSDISMEIVESPTSIQIMKQVGLIDGFKVCLASGRVGSPEDLKGFAFLGQRADGDPVFSWDWFNVDGPGHARKIQEQGEVRFEMAERNGQWEIVSTEFLTDVSLRLMPFGSTSPPDNIRWRIGIEKGSFLRWPVEADGKVSV